MSRFEDLCRAYARASKEYARSKGECSYFAGRLVRGMLKFYRCPEKEAHFFLLEKGQRKTVTALRDALYFSEEGAWCLGLGLTLRLTPDTIYPCETVILRILMRKVNGRFAVRIGPAGKEFEIFKEQEFRAFYEDVFIRVKEMYEKGSQKFLRSPASVRHIGFLSN